jgi:hypothetical protein
MEGETMAANGAVTSRTWYQGQDLMANRRGVQTYIAQYATSPNGPWTECYVGKASSCTVTGLTSGTQYWFQVRAIGAAGPSAWSDPATKRAT